jgi:hypothetical protein
MELNIFVLVPGLPRKFGPKQREHSFGQILFFKFGTDISIIGINTDILV